MKSQILVTGSNGQLGKTIQDLHLSKIDSYEFFFASRQELDITNKSSVEGFFLNKNITYCINCAAYTAVDKAEEESSEAFKINAEGVKNLADICKISNTVLIHISTDYVFDGKTTIPYKEEDKTNPINVYGKSKLAGEEFIKEVLDRYFIIRTSWLYSKHGRNFVKTISEKISDNANLKVITSEIGTPTNCIDLAQFIFHLIQTKNKNYGVFHFSNLGETTWYDFAVEISKYFTDYNSIKIERINNFKALARRPKFSVLDKTKVNSSKFKIPKWTCSLKIQLK